MNNKWLELLAGFQLAAVTHPIQIIAYLALTTLFGILTIYFAYNEHSKLAFWCVIGLMLTDFVFFVGDDTGHHVYRIAAISEQIKHRNVSLLLTNPTTGEAFPIFVYYSFLPYILPTVLNLAGIPALFAFKVAMGLHLIVFAAGFQVLINKLFNNEQSNSGFLIAILFFSANYVWGLWHTRAALAEIWVYSFVPWVVASMLCLRSARSLTALFFIQICGNPLLFPQSFVCELVVALGLSREPLVFVGRRCAAPLAIAFVFAAPFWLPQLLWMHFILGNASLPVLFSDTFLSIGELLDPRYMRNIGLWMPFAVALMIAASGARLLPRVWMLVLTFVMLMALQTTYLRSITIHLPLIQQIQFVWRLMLPTAFVAFGALLAGWGVPDWSARRTLTALALLSAIGMFIFHPGKIALLSAESDGGGNSSEYLNSDNVWGVRLFAPNYSQIPKNCGVAQGNEIRSASFTDLRTGISADRRFISVRNAPIGFVDYNVDVERLRPSACDDKLVLGPLKPNGRVWVAEDKLNNLLCFRVIAIVVGLLAIIPFNRLPQRLLPWPGAPHRRH